MRIRIVTLKAGWGCL